MQSNIDFIMDDLNDFPDSWVELYNSGSETVNLSEFCLGVTEKAEAAWKLPKYSLSPKAFCLVYCDKVGKDWHTDYRLESGKGCTLYLFRNGEIVDRLPADMKKQPAPNVAFGRITDASSQWAYQLQPTPGKENSGETCSCEDILGDPVFSIPGRLLKEGEKISVALSLPDGAPEGTEIRYTVDCSEPTEESKRYTGTSIRVGASKVIRAKLFCKGYLSPRAVTQSYLYLNHDVTLPVISVCTDSKYLYDEKIGIYVEGTYGGGKKNYEYNWRRPINFEYFGEDLENSELNQVCESRITGAASRGHSLKSLGIYANKRFGEKRLKYEFFPDQRPGVTDFKSVMLRNAGNDFDGLYMRDALIQRHTASNVNLDWQAWSPAIIFINGEYKGMLNIRERSNEDNIYTNYNGLEDIDMIENWWELKEGNRDSWEAFKSFYNEHGHSWEEYDKLLDVQEFMDVMIMNFYFCNLDFPGNNIVMWRPQNQDGRWRVMVKDTDFTMGIYSGSADYQIFRWFYNPNYDSGHNWGANGYEATRLFRRLMEDERFYREFIDRMAIYMGDFLNYDRIWELWEQMHDKIKYEYQYHHDLINRWWPDYDAEMRKAQDWVKKRTAIMYDQINDYYKVGAPKALVVNCEGGDTDQMSISLNGVKLSRNSFSGKFFAGREMTVEGENVSGWEVKEILPDGPSSQTISGNSFTFTMPDNCYAVTIVAKSSADAINEIVSDSPTSSGAIYDLSGMRRERISKGLNIVRNGSSTIKIFIE